MGRGRGSAIGGIDVEGAAAADAAGAAAVAGAAVAAGRRSLLRRPTLRPPANPRSAATPALLPCRWAWTWSLRCRRPRRCPPVAPVVGTAPPAPAAAAAAARASRSCSCSPRYRSVRSPNSRCSLATSSACGAHSSHGIFDVRTQVAGRSAAATAAVLVGLASVRSTTCCRCRFTNQSSTDVSVWHKDVATNSAAVVLPTPFAAYMRHRPRHS